MSKEKTNDIHENIDNTEECLNNNSDVETESKEKVDKNSEELENNKKCEAEDASSEQKVSEIRELKDQIIRLAAEFDNYKKRTKKEKERIYVSAVADVVSVFLPVMDNVERALQASEGNDQSIRDGVLMIHRQIVDVLSDLGVKPIETKGKQFNPEFHEAVMHVEDQEYGENEITEEFQKGYIYKDDVVIRHSVVKVAN